MIERVEDSDGQQTVELENVMLFKYKRALQHEPHEQLIVNPNRPKKRVKFTEEDALNEDFMRKLKMKNSMQYFLSRVDESNVDERVDRWIDDKRNRMVKDRRAQLREKLINSIRYKQDDKAIKVIDIGKEDFVQFQGESVQVQNFATKDQYYLLHMGSPHNFRKVPEIYLPQQAANALKFQEEMSSQEQQPEDQDSNREDHPDYDYPEEDYSDNSDQGVIDHDDYPSSQEEVDEEQLYRRYLKKCKKDPYDSDDDDLQYFPY